MSRAAASAVLALTLVVCGCTGADRLSGGAAPAAPHGPVPTESAPADRVPADRVPTDPVPTGSLMPETGAQIPAEPPRPPVPVEAAPAPPGPVDLPDEILRHGAEGAAVLAAQQRLHQLGFWLGEADGTYADPTAQAVLALQKLAGLAPDGVLGPQTREVLEGAAAAALVPTPRTTQGRALEIDKERQVLLVVTNGRVEWLLNTSTGSGRSYLSRGVQYDAQTPEGEFSTLWQVNGMDKSPLGRLYRPKYFHRRGIAVHGYGSVPAYPASHGCVRVSNRAMDWLWEDNIAPLGTPVLVY